MALIDFKTLILELSEDSFERVKYRISPRLNFYYIDSENADRYMLLEKLGDYLRTFELKTGKRDNDLAIIYTTELMKYIDYRIKEDTRADRYYNKAKEIIQTIREKLSDNLLQNLEDFTKIFLCLYSEYVKDPEKNVEKISFYVRDIDIDAVLQYLEIDSPKMTPAKDIAPGFMRGFIPKEVFKGVDDTRKAMAQLDLGINFPQQKKRPDLIFEPIHDVIEEEEQFDKYSYKIFAVILLVILYRRIWDFESGLSQEGE